MARFIKIILRNFAKGYDGFGLIIRGVIALFIWIYEPDLSSIEEFKRTYAGGGAWDRFLSTAPGYLGLTFTSHTPTLFQVAELWESKQHRERFVASNETYNSMCEKFSNLFLTEHSLPPVEMAGVNHHPNTK